MILRGEGGAISARFFSFFFVLCGLFCGQSDIAYADPIAVRMVGVVDGDTIKVILHGMETNIRLHGIDSPEKRQAFGQAAARTMRQLTQNKTITIQILDKDRYRRPVAMVYADGSNINGAMVALGYAWTYSKYCHQDFCNHWIDLQKRAKEQNIGLWNDKRPMPPWEWRRKLKP
jgi:endonuclease YncB( thermonuclease family)